METRLLPTVGRAVSRRLLRPTAVRRLDPDIAVLQWVVVVLLVVVVVVVVLLVLRIQ